MIQRVNDGIRGHKKRSVVKIYQAYRARRQTRSGEGRGREGAGKAGQEEKGDESGDMEAKGRRVGWRGKREGMKDKWGEFEH